MYKIVRWLLNGVLAPHGGQSYTHQSCTKVLELTWEPQILPWGQV